MIKHLSKRCRKVVSARAIVRVYTIKHAVRERVSERVRRAEGRKGGREDEKNWGKNEDEKRSTVDRKR
jgi:hypothetical protein